MPSTTTKVKRTKRPDARPNGKRRRKESQAEVEKNRLERVAKNEAKGKIVAVERVAKLPKISPIDDDDNNNNNNNNDDDEAKKRRGQELRKVKKDPAEIRVRALHKVLRQIKALEEKEKAGVQLDEAQKLKIGRFDAVISELEELQKVEDSENEGEEDSDEEGSDDAQ
jgi:uncharacterized protein with WD repeat